VKSLKQIRNFHKFVGIIFLLPAFTISVTAILLSLNGALHLDKVKINIRSMSKNINNFEVKATLMSQDKQYIGTKTGLFIVETDSCYIVPELSGFDIKSLLAVNDTIFIGSKQGLWKYLNYSARLINSQDISHVSLAGENLLAISLGKKGLKLVDFSGNEKGPQNYSKFIVSQANVTELNQYQTLHKFIVDLHTGEAIVGKSLKNYWVGFCSLQLFLITLTGCWFIFKKKKVKIQKAVRAAE